MPGNPVQYCDRDFQGGDKACPIFGDASNPGIIEIVGGGPNEVFVGYAGQHDFSNPNDNSWSDPFRHDGKIDRVQLKPDGTIDVVRFDLVAGNSVEFWHNRTIYRMLYDHFIHKHELYVGTEHGIDKISPDLWFPPNKAWPYNDYLFWMSDHLHPFTCMDELCTGDENHDDQRMGEWRGLALSPQGDLWVGGKWSAGKIFYTPLNSEMNPDGTPKHDGKTGWFQRGGSAFDDPKTGTSYAFGFQFCGTSGARKEWDGSAWVLKSCTPGSGTPPVFVPPNPGDPVGISAVAVTPDGTSWWASGPFGGDPAYGIASYDGHQFRYFDPMSQAGMLESNVTDMVALPDGRLVLGSQSTGLTIWDPAAKTHVSIRAGDGIPDDHIVRLKVDTMVDPPALQVATRGGAAVLRILP